MKKMKVKAPLGLVLHFSKRTDPSSKQVIDIGGWANTKSMLFGDIVITRGKPVVTMFSGTSPNEAAVIVDQALKFLATSKMARRAGVRPPYREVRVARLTQCPYRRKDIERDEEVAHSKAAAREWEEMTNWRY